MPYWVLEILKTWGHNVIGMEGRFMNRPYSAVFLSWVRSIQEQNDTIRKGGGYGDR